MVANEGYFDLNLVGDVTGEKWLGKFKCKLRLSHRDTLAKDNLRRQLLGGSPELATERASSLAFIASELSVRLVDAPAWWKAADNGLDLADDNVMAEVYSNCVRLERELFDKTHKKAEDASDELKKKLEADAPPEIK
jgi:hypothetical protein